jgi:tetrahydromethanopterin S-methyltransferase subunit B
MTDEKFEITLQSGILNQEDLNLIKDLEHKLQNDDFTNVISNFEENVLNLNLSNEKFKIYNTFVNSLKLTNNLDPSLFQSNDYSSRDGDLVDCVLATIAFIVAVIALVGIEVGTFGLATAAAVIGYIAASAAWVRACK